MVGTPGRLLDVLNRNTYLVLRELEVLVLDEGEDVKAMWIWMFFFVTKCVIH